MSNQTFPSSTDLEIDVFLGSAFSEGILSFREALLPIYMFHLDSKLRMPKSIAQKYQNLTNICVIYNANYV